MIPLGVRLTVQPDPKTMTRAEKRVMKEGFLAMATHWHSNFLPRHFEESAKTKYRHQNRSSKWQKRKEQLARLGKAQRGGLVDNVLTGQLEQTAKAIKTISAFPTRATVRMSGPKYITMNPTTARGQPDKAKEITTVTRREQKTLNAIFKKHVVRGFNKIRRRSKKVIRIG